MIESVLVLVGLVSYVFATAALVPLVAIEKDRSAVGWFFIGLLCTPLLALIALAAIPRGGTVT